MRTAIVRDQGFAAHLDMACRNVWTADSVMCCSLTSRSLCVSAHIVLRLFCVTLTLGAHA
jgi:hypothetical protein